MHDIKNLSTTKSHHSGPLGSKRALSRFIFGFRRQSNVELLHDVCHIIVSNLIFILSHPNPSIWSVYLVVISQNLSMSSIFQDLFLSFSCRFSGPKDFDKATIATTRTAMIPKATATCSFKYLGASRLSQLKKNCDDANFEGWRSSHFAVQSQHKMLWEGWFNRLASKLTRKCPVFFLSQHLPLVKSKINCWRPKNFERIHLRSVFSPRHAKASSAYGVTNIPIIRAMPIIVEPMPETKWAQVWRKRMVWFWSSKALPPKSMTKNMTIGVKRLKDLLPSKPLQRHKTQTQKLRRIKNGWRAGHTTESFVYVPADFSPSVHRYFESAVVALYLDP